MANITSGNPFIIDVETATAILSASNVFEVYSIGWVSASTGHIVEVKDADGNMKYEAIASIDNYVDRATFKPPLKFNGLKVDNLDAGTIYIYCTILK